MDPWEGTQLSPVKPTPDPMNPGDPGSISVYGDAVGDSDVGDENPEVALFNWDDALRVLTHGPLSAQAMVIDMLIPFDGRTIALFKEWLRPGIEKGCIQSTPSGQYQLTKKGADHLRGNS